MKNLTIVLAALVLSVPAVTSVMAQSSASYRLEESVFNAGGHPAQGMTMGSASYRISMNSIGEGVVAVNLAGASYSVDSGFTPAYRPPGIIENLRFVSVDTMEWTPYPGASGYNLYRNKLIYLDQYGPCFQHGLTSPTATDPEPPTKNVGWYYLVTAENRLDEEGGKGSDSSGDPRSGAWCP